MGCVPGALVSVPRGDSGAGHLRSKQLCLSLCVGQACALSLCLQMVSEKGCFLTLNVVRDGYVWIGGPCFVL